MQLEAILPATNQRAFAVGTTGSGKSTLARTILPRYRHVLAIDPKITLGATERNPEGHLRGFLLVRDPDELPRAADQARWIQYRPDPEFQRFEDWDRVYRWAFQAGRRLIYTDEVYLIQDGQRVPDGFRACVTSGRERGIGMLHAAQRPCQIPKFIYTESEVFFCFELRDDDDRTCMSKIMGPQVRQFPASGHAFYYSAPRQPLRYLTLRL